MATFLSMTRSTSNFSILWILWLAVLQGRDLAAQSEPQSFEMSRLNQVYSNLVREVLPVRQGPISVQLNFLEHSVEIRNNRLEVTRNPLDNGHKFRVVVTFQGEAEIESRLEMAGLPATLRDDIRLPLQSISVSGRAAIRRDPEGYWISPQELPPFIQVEVESQLAEKMVTLCKGLAFLPGFGSACQGLQQSLAFIRLPLPAPGDTYRVPFSVLTDAEIREFDEYLSAAIH